jgi:hypothetical protein
MKLVTAKVVPSSLVLSFLTIEAIRSPETSVLTRATQHPFQKTALFIATAVKISNLT